MYSGCDDRVKVVVNPGWKVLSFESRRGVAQLEARVVWDDEVAGSSPVTPTTFLSRKNIHSNKWYKTACVSGVGLLGSLVIGDTR